MKEKSQEQSFYRNKIAMLNKRSASAQKMTIVKEFSARDHENKN